MNIAIILAAGRSKRMEGINKLFAKIRGRPLIFYTVRIFENCPQIHKIILVVGGTETKKFAGLAEKYGFRKICKIVRGGRERRDSALAGLRAAEKLKAKMGDLLLFHNGANPLAGEKDIRAIIKAAQKYKAAVPGQIARDTVKKINNNGFVAKSLDRKKIFLAQTPQAIEYSLAEKAFKAARRNHYGATDDVCLVERLGKPVKTVPCSRKNIKVTTKDDLKIIKAFLDK